MSPRTEHKPGAGLAGLHAAAPVFAALGDGNRLRLLTLLCAGSALSIVQLTRGSSLTRQAITKHLAVLAEAGLVRDIKQGRERRWLIETQEIERARLALQRLAQQWDQALARLRVAVEE